MKSDIRHRDMTVEREIAKFLDRHLYSSSEFTNVIRTNTLDEQYSGSDVVLSIPSKNLFSVVVDEKAQTQYINHPLPTVAFELSFLNVRDNVEEGWFTSSEKKTEYYLLLWIIRANQSWDLKLDDIKEVEYMLVSRHALLKTFADKGYGIDKLQEMARQVRASEIAGVHHKRETSQAWMFYSPNLAEKPINIVVKKKFLLKHAIMSGVISV